MTTELNVSRSQSGAVARLTQYVRAEPRLFAFFAVATVVLLLVPLTVSDPFLQNELILALIFVIVATNWDLSLGYAGVFNFAHVAVFGVGTYTAAVLTTHWNVSPWLATVASVPVGLVVSGIAAVPAIRLRGIYVALGTFAVSVLVNSLVVSNTDIMGGASGLPLVPTLSLGSVQLTGGGTVTIYFVEALMFANLIFLRFIVQSRLGLSSIAARDYEDYALSRGINVTQQRLWIILISSVFTSIAGAVYAEYLTVASPDIFSFGYSSLFLSMVLLGGVGSTFGPAIAAIGLTLVTQSRALVGLGPMQFVISSAIILVVVRFLPGGIWLPIVDVLGGAAARQRELAVASELEPVTGGGVGSAVSEAPGDEPAGGERSVSVDGGDDERTGVGRVGRKDRA